MTGELSRWYVYVLTSDPRASISHEVIVSENQQKNSMPMFGTDNP